MTDSGTPDAAVLGKARKLLNLYRGASGGEQDKARNLLERLLSVNALTLADLEPHLPATTDASAALSVRPALAHLARLDAGSEEEVSAALSALVDEIDLTEAERARLLARLSVERLVESRAAAWLLDLADDEVAEPHLLDAAQAVSNDTVLAVGGMSVAETVRSLVVGEARRRARPERTLRAEGAPHATYLAELCRLTSRLPARVVHDEAAGWSVRAHLGGHELALVRAAANRDELERALERAAREAAREAFARRQA